MVHIHFFKKTHPGALDEFKELIASAGASVLSVITGKRTVPEAKYFIGTGKAEEIQIAVRALKADLVIFDHELSPAQERNLEKLFQCRVVDRTGLILDIFAQRARTFEGKLQVELAQLSHLSTRLVRGWEHLERQRGGIGLRGPGETQLETDRRLLATRIRSIHKQLEKVEKQREQGRRSRKRAEIPTVSLVGDTNAGKSTLFNRLTHENIYVADQLFATLDPTLRRITLPPLGRVILADTVGFIRDLPHDLVAAFRATLEETCQADLLLHVIDASSIYSNDLIHEVNKVLLKIGAHEVPQLQLYNKIDLREGAEARIDYDEHDRPWRVWCSALTGEGMSLVQQAIVELLADTILDCEVVLGVEEGKIRSELYRLDVVKSEKQDKHGKSHLRLAIQRKDYQAIFMAKEESNN